MTRKVLFPVTNKLKLESCYPVDYTLSIKANDYQSQPRYAVQRLAAPMQEAVATPPIESGESESTVPISLTVEEK